MTLEKEAQARSWLNRLKITPKRWVRGLVSSKYRGILRFIEEKDDASRKACLEAMPTVKKAVKLAGQAYNAKFYDRVMHNVYMAFKQAEPTWALLDQIIEKRDEVLREYQQGDMPSAEEKREVHERLNKNKNLALKQKAADEIQQALLTMSDFKKEESLLAEARTWSQFFGEGDILEKMVGGNLLQERKNGAYKALEAAQKIEGKFKRLFTDLDTYRTNGDIGKYVEALKKYKVDFDKSEDNVKDVYTKFFAEEFAKDVQAEEGKANQEVEAPSEEAKPADPKAGKIDDPIPAEPGPHSPPGQAAAAPTPAGGQAPGRHDVRLETPVDPKVQAVIDQQAAQQGAAQAPGKPARVRPSQQLARKRTQTGAAKTEVPPPAGWKIAPENKGLYNPGEDTTDQSKPLPAFELAAAASKNKNHKDLLAGVADFPEDLPTVAASVNKILIKAEHEYNIGNKGIAAALLAKASQICEDNGDIRNSIKFLVAAQRL